MSDEAKKNIVTVRTNKFGVIEVPHEHIYLFPEGLLGFAEIKRYFVMQNPGGGPFQWLHSLEPPQLSFIVCDPLLFYPEYRVYVRPDDIAVIQLDDIGRGIVLVIVTVPRDPKAMTANLRGPLVFNPVAKLGKQLVLNDTAFSVRYPILGREQKGNSDAGPDKTN